MMFKSLYRSLIIAFIAILAASCDNTLDQIGLSTQPNQDRLTLGLDTLQLYARSVKVDSMFCRTTSPVLGEYADPLFGSMKSEYIGEFYLPTGSGFKKGAVIDSVKTVLIYTTMMGDSLAPMELSVFEVIKSLKETNNYTNIDPKEFSDLTAPIGVQTFTGKNSNFEILTYTTDGGTTISLNEYHIDVKLPNALGERFLAEYNKTGHGKMADTDSFREFFPGLYYTTSFGNSTIINVDLTSLHVYYHYLDEKGSSLNLDTIRTDNLKLSISPEVKQINHIKNSNDELLIENERHTYIKSPAGINTEIIFPISEFHEKLKSQALNMVNFTLYAIPDESDSKMVKIDPPEYLLLVNKDSLNGFFEKRKLQDDITCFMSEQFDSSSYSYQFNNLSTMINYYNMVHKGEPYDLTYYIIPVKPNFTTVQQSIYSTAQQVLVSIHNQMWPTAVMLDKREGSLQLELIFSNLK